METINNEIDFVLTKEERLELFNKKVKERTKTHDAVLNKIINETNLLNMIKIWQNEVLNTNNSFSIMFNTAKDEFEANMFPVSIKLSQYIKMIEDNINNWYYVTKTERLDNVTKETKTIVNKVFNTVLISLDLSRDLVQSFWLLWHSIDLISKEKVDEYHKEYTELFDNVYEALLKIDETKDEAETKDKTK